MGSRPQVLRVRALEWCGVLVCGVVKVLGLGV